MKNEELFRLLDYFQSSSIAELSLRDGEFEIALSKASTTAPMMVAPSAPVAAAAATPAVEATTEKVVNGDEITAPLVGTFYSSPSPEADPFVSVGSVVKKGDALCIVEAMKMLNELPAPYDCEILEIHAKNAELVSFGQPLFTVKRSV